MLKNRYVQFYQKIRKCHRVVQFYHKKYKKHKKFMYRTKKTNIMFESLLLV